MSITRVIMVASGLLFSNAASFVHAPIIGRPDVPDSVYRALGARPEFASVGHIFAGGSQASGVLIASRWVITAAHVVRGVAPDSTFLEFGDKRYAVRRIVLHPNYGPSRTTAGLALTAFDVALLELTTDVAVTPAKMMSALPAVGSLVTVIGFGATGNRLSATPDTSKGVKRGARNRLDQVGGEYRGDSLAAHLLVSDLDIPNRDGFNATGNSSAEPLEGVCTGGDSGGGMFVEQNGVWMLAATFSNAAYNIGELSLGNYAGTRNVHVGVAAHRAWIATVTGVP